MKRYVWVILLGVFAYAACKKDSSSNAKASFTTTKSGYYIGETLTVSNTSSGKSYSWDFGDGTTASTSQSPTHVYSTSGSYKIKLTVNGSTSATKSVTVFNGNASYQVANQTQIDLPLVSFSADDLGNLIDFEDDGTVKSGGLSDTVFTNDATVYIGGTLPNDSTFIAVYPHPITLYTNNVIALSDTSQVYVSSIRQKTINQFFHLKSSAVKTTLGPRVNALRHIAR